MKSICEAKTFIPGSEWVYFKLYTGTKTADTILRNELYGFIQEMIKNESIDKWFFIRYSDPDFHLRLRIHLKEQKDFNRIFSRFFEICKPLVDANLIWNIQCDTYQREMERYGVNSISFVEEIFYVDSDYIIRILRQIDDVNSEQLRWQLALLLVDDFFSAFSYEISQRKELMNTMADNFKKEFGFIHKNISNKLNVKCRNNRKYVENVLSRGDEFAVFLDLIDARRLAVIPIVEKLISMDNSGELNVTIKSLLPSLIHMSMNRWFRTKNRLHEMVIYEFLSRYYISEIAKNILKNEIDK